MRMLLKVSMPVGKSNDAAKDGTLMRTIESTMAALKPEAAYFYPEEGKRTAIMVFDMVGSWQLPAILEPLFQSMGAALSVTPVMNAEDLQRGFKEADV